MSFSGLTRSFVFFVCTGLCASIQAAETTASKDFLFKLPPRVEKIFANYTIFQIKGECRMSIPDHTEVNMIAVGKGGAGQVDFNDGRGPQNVSKGTKITEIIKDEQIVTMTAQAAAQVGLTNDSDQEVIAYCHLVK